MPGTNKKSDEEDVLRPTGAGLSSRSGQRSTAAPKSKSSSESADVSAKSAEHDPLQASCKVNSGQPLLLQTTQEPANPVPPMLSPRARERLKFFLGASEDNSSDEEVLMTKPPSGAYQPAASAPKSAAELAAADVFRPSSSMLK